MSFLLGEDSTNAKVRAVYLSRAEKSKRQQRSKSKNLDTRFTEYLTVNRGKTVTNQGHTQRSGPKTAGGCSL